MAFHRLLGFFAFCLGLFGPTSGEAYQFEVGLDYGEIDGDLVDGQSVGVSGTYYFTPVATTSGPYAELGFLSQQSSLTLRAVREDTEITPTFQVGPITNPPVLNEPPSLGTAPALGSGSASDMDTYAVDGRYVHRNGWFVGGRFARSDGETDFNSDSRGEAFGFSSGWYLTPSTTLSLFGSRTTTELESSSQFDGFGVLPSINFVSRTETQRDSIGVSVQHLGRVASQYFKIRGQYQYSDLESDLFSQVTITGGTFTSPEPVDLSVSVSGIESSGLALDWYFGRSFNLGVSANRTDDGSIDEDRFVFGASWFVTTHLALRAEYISVDISQGSLADTDRWRFGIFGRI